MSELSDVLDFDHVIYLSRKGEIRTNREGGPWPSAPEAVDPDVNSTAINGYPGWDLITAGLTGQHGYRGPWLHDSEIIEGGVERHIRDHATEHGGGFYVAIYATYTCEECGGAGVVGADEVCPLIATGECEPGGMIEGWAIAHLLDWKHRTLESTTKGV